MTYALSNTAQINKNIYHKYGAINPTIMLLMASSYDHVRLLNNISSHFVPNNQFLIHNFEIKERILQGKHLKQMAKRCGDTLRWGNHSIGQFCLGTGGSLLAAALDMTHNILTQHVIISLNNDLDDKSAPKETNLDAVKKHDYKDLAPIYVSPMDGKTVVFEPRTITGVKGIVGTKRKVKSMTNQMEEYLSLSLEERVAHLNKYTEVREITKKDARKDRLDDVMIGQRGIFAKTKIPENTLMGFYSGAYCATQFECKHAMNDVGKANYDTYVFGFTNQPLPRINGYHYGNRLTLFNASSCYSGSLVKVARDIAHKTNIHVAYARSGENPHQDIIDNPEACDLVLYYSNREIPKGQQLYVDYGMKYWKSKVTDFIDATQEELNNAVRAFRHKKKVAKRKKALR